MSFGIVEVLLLVVSALSVGWAWRVRANNLYLIATNNELAARSRALPPAEKEDSSEQLEQLQEQFGRLQEALDQALEDSVEKEEMAESLRLELDEARSNIEASDYGVLERRYAELRDDYDVLDTIYRDLKSSYDSLKEELAREPDFERSDEEADQLRQEAARSKKEADRLRLDIQHLEEKVAGLARENVATGASFGEAAEELQKEIGLLKEDVAQARKEAQDWEAAANRHLESVREKSRAIEDLARQVEFKDQRITQIEEERDNVEVKFGEIQVRLAHARADIGKAEARIGAAERSADKAAEAAEEAEARLQRALDSSAEEAALKKAEKYSAELVAELNKTAAQNLDLKKTVGDLRNQVALLDKKLSAARVAGDEDLFERRLEEMERRERFVKQLAAKANGNRKRKP